MIIRARLKPVQVVDPQLICCDVRRRNIDKYALFEVEIYPEDISREMRYCEGCGRGRLLTGAKLVTPFGGFERVCLELCDLDERTLM